MTNGVLNVYPVACQGRNGLFVTRAVFVVSVRVEVLRSTSNERNRGISLRLSTYRNDPFHEKKGLSFCNFLEGRGKKDVVEQSEDSCSFMRYIGLAMCDRGEAP